MNMDGQIRVYTDARYKDLYNNMKSRGVVEDFHELFFVCACLDRLVSKPIGHSPASLLTLFVL